MAATVQSVERAAAVLELLGAEDEPLGLAQIAAALGLAKPTAHGLLRTLAGVGFVAQDPGSGRYLLGAEVLRLGTARLDVNELRARALNWTDVLAARTQEAAAVAVFRRGGLVLAHQVLADARDRPASADAPAEAFAGGRVPGADPAPQGAGLPLHASALGKVLLAYDPSAGRAVVSTTAPPLTSYTHRTITDRVVLHRELAALRQRGWGCDVEEQRPGWAGIAAPVRDLSGHVVAAVGIEGPVSRVCDGRSRPAAALVGHVQRAASAISRELGHERA